MALIPLKYGQHWDWCSFDGDPYEWLPARVRIKPEITKWLSVHKVRWSLVPNGSHPDSICILDNQMAMLFKLTWGGS